MTSELLQDKSKQEINLFSLNIASSRLPPFQILHRNTIGNDFLFIYAHQFYTIYPMSNQATPAEEMPRITSNAIDGSSSQGTLIKSPLVSNAVKKHRPSNNDQLEKTINRKHMVDEKRRRNNALIMSPAQAQSPKAHPSTAIKSPSHSRGLPPIAGISSLHASRFTGLPTGSPLAAPAPDLSSSLTITKNVSVEQMSKHFEEWMKIAADNKINAKNSWSLALIDYFSELTLLRDGDTINFQRASCTLDGCVKIYSSRVDCVADETGKLLNGLMEDDGQGKAKIENSDPELSPEEVLPVSKDKKKQSTSVLANTLEKNVENLNLKRFETEAPPSVVPIFKKISTLFDENASRSFLLSTIPIDQNGLFTLNSMSNSDFSEKKSKGTLLYFDEFQIDKKSFCFPNSCNVLPSIENILTDQITPTVDLCIELINQLSEISTNIDHLIKIQHEINQNEPCEMEVDFGDIGGGFDANLPIEAETMENEFYSLTEPVNPMEHIEDNNEIVNNLPSDNASSESNEFSNFDSISLSTQNQVLASSMQEMTLDEMPLVNESQFKGNWAGPQHWKIQRQLAAFSASSNQPKPKRQTKIENVQCKKNQIDFCSVDAIDIDKLFAKPNSLSSITSSLALIQERSSRRNLLPEDFKFTSNNLLSLFIKPIVNYGMKVKMVPIQKPLSAETSKSSTTMNQSIEEGQETWQLVDEPTCSMANDHPVDRDSDNDQDINNHEEFYENVEFLPENNSPSILEGNVESENKLNNNILNQQIFVPQIKPQKNIDIKKLKEIIFNVLKASSSETTFSFLYKKILEMNCFDSLSHSYCFICLLHLANEHGFILYNDPSLSSLLIRMPPK